MSAEDAAARLVKVKKKLAKLTKQQEAGTVDADEAAAEVARLQKRIAKLQRLSASAATEPEDEVEAAPPATNGTKKGKKRAKDGEDAEQLTPSASAGKKLKGGDSAHHKHHSKHHGKHAEVGDAKLATAGKPIVKALYSEHPEVAGLSAKRVAALREERETTVEGFGPDDDFVAGEPGPGAWELASPRVAGWPRGQPGAHASVWLLTRAACASCRRAHGHQAAAEV
jgi:ATP-dependent RNA helicase DBP3